MMRLGGIQKLILRVITQNALKRKGVDMFFKKKILMITALMGCCIFMLGASGENPVSAEKSTKRASRSVPSSELVLKKKDVSVQDQTLPVTEFSEAFTDGKLPNALWQGTNDGIEFRSGYVAIMAGGQLLSQKVFPHGSLEFKMTITNPLTFGSIGWGFREKHGSRPRITFSLEDNMVLRTVVSNDNGKSFDFRMGAIDTNEHVYKIDWNEKEIKFYFDGKEIFQKKLAENFIISPRPITIYNTCSDAVVNVRAISYKTYEPAEKVAQIQSELKFSLTKVMDIKFKETIHVDETPLPQLSDFWKERKYVIFTRPYIQHCYLNDTPEADEILDVFKGIKIFAAPGEYEPLTFSVHALDDIKEYRAQITDLTGGDNKTIAVENIKAGIVRNLNKRLLYSAKYCTDYLFLPTFIETLDKVDIEKNTNRQFWFTLHVPENASPGIYTGMIEFEPVYGPEGGIPTTIPVSIEILPFKLEKTEGYSFAFWHPLRGRHYTMEAVASDFQEMHKHGMTTIFGCIPGIAWNETFEKDKKIEFSLSKASRFLQLIEAYKAAGFTEKILCTVDKAREWANRKVKVQFSPEWNVEYIKYMKAFSAMMKKNNYPEFIFQPMDEVAWHTEDAREIFLKSVKLLKEAGAETEIDGPFDKFMSETSLQDCDVLNINGGLTTLEKIKELKAKGKTLWAYNNDVEGIRPEVMRYSCGYWLWLSGARGIGNWAYNCKSGTDIYDDLTGTSSNFVYFYPKTKTENGGPALSFEAFREGIDDLRYLLTWAKAVKKLRVSGMTAEADASEKVVSSIMEKVKYIERLRGVAAFSKTYYKADGQKVVVGDFKLPNQLKYSDYDQIRYAIAKETERIKTFK